MKLELIKCNRPDFYNTVTGGMRHRFLWENKFENDLSLDKTYIVKYVELFPDKYTDKYDLVAFFYTKHPFIEEALVQETIIKFSIEDRRENLYERLLVEKVNIDLLFFDCFYNIVNLITFKGDQVGNHCDLEFFDFYHGENSKKPHNILFTTEFLKNNLNQEYLFGD